MIKKHRNGGVFLLPEFWTVDISRAVIIIPTHPSVDPEHPYTLLPTIPREYTFDAIITSEIWMNTASPYRDALLYSNRGVGIFIVPAPLPFICDYPRY